MSRILASTCLAAVLLIGSSGQVRATEVGYGRNIGLGFELGEPTGFVGKVWVGRTNAWDFGVGFDGYASNFCTNPNNGVCSSRLTFNVDYLWQSNLVKGTAQLDWHIGAGGRVNIWNFGNTSYVALGPRMPVGLDLMFNNPNFLELFFEIAPAIYVGPGVQRILWFGFDGDIGVRFYF